MSLRGNYNFNPAGNSNMAALANQKRLKTTLMRSGANAGPYFNRKGMASIMDAPLVEDHINQRTKALGRGKVVYKMFDPDTNEPIDDAVMEHNGKMYSSGVNGGFSMVDGEYLAELLRVKEEVEKEVDKLVDYALSSNEGLATVLCCSEANAIKYAKKDGLVEFMRDNPVPTGSPALFSDDVIEVLDKCDACPLSMALYPPHGEKYATGIAKLRALITKVMPIIMAQPGTAQTVRQETA
jgi:hypothetical protein